MIDPDFLLAFTTHPFEDYELPVEKLTLPDGEDVGNVVRIFRPTLSHYVNLATIGTPMVPDSIVGEDGWSFERTAAALAILLTPAEIPQVLGLLAGKSYALAEAVLRGGFGPWTTNTPEAWGNPLLDMFLKDLSAFCHDACKAPDLFSEEGGKSAATPWPLALVTRCLSSGLSLDESWGLTVSEAFWLSEACSEARGHGTALVPIKTKAALAREHAEKAARVAAGNK